MVEEVTFLSSHGNVEDSERNKEDISLTEKEPVVHPCIYA